MSEIFKEASPGIDYSLEERITPVQRDDTVNNLKATYSGIKTVLINELEGAYETGKIFWDREQVVDRPIDINGLVGKVRYIPTFAYRQTRYFPGSLDTCSLCLLTNDRIQITDSGNDGDFDEFNNSFNVHLNNFPYLDKQVLLSSGKHRELFSEDQYKIIIEFMVNSGFAGAGMQLKGSGASIPDHAHISVFDEALPIFNSDYRPVKEAEGTVTAKSVDHPAVCFKVYSGSRNSKLCQMKSLLQELKSRGLSYNLYFDNQADVYIIPRTNLSSKSMGITVGQAEVAGIFNSYVDHSETTDIDELKRQYWEIFTTVTGEQIAEAIKDTTIPNTSHGCIQI
ncbi:MAG TPA: hypothetical protein VF733_01660 [Candidatus Saccharimonadales bacterium]